MKDKTATIDPRIHKAISGSAIWPATLKKEAESPRRISEDTPPAFRFFFLRLGSKLLRLLYGFIYVWINKHRTQICAIAILALFLLVLPTKSHAIFYGGIFGGYSKLDPDTGSSDNAFPIGGKIGVKAADLFFEFQPMYFVSYAGANHAIGYPGVIGIQVLHFFYVKGLFGGIFVKPKGAAKSNKLFYGGGLGLRAPAPGMAVIFEGNVMVVEKLSNMMMYMGLVGLEFAF